MPPPCVLCSPMLFTNVVLCSLPLCSDQCGTFLCTLLGLWLPFWAPASPWVGLNQTEANVARTSADSRSLCPGGREDLIDTAKSLQNLLSQTFPEVPGHSSKGTHSNSSFFSYQLGILGESFDLKSLAFLMCRTWTMWRQPSLSPLMAVGLRDHMHTTRCTQHTRRENAVMVTATQIM